MVVQDQLFQVTIRAGHERDQQVVGQHTRRLGEAGPLGVAPLPVVAGRSNQCGCRSAAARLGAEAVDLQAVVAPVAGVGGAGQPRGDARHDGLALVR